METIQLPQVTSVAAILVASAIALYGTYSSSSSSRRKLPPGPRGLPLLGNVLQVPTNNSVQKIWWPRIIELAGHGTNRHSKPVIIIGDGNLAKELLDKRSSIYSGRPVELYLSRYIDPDEKYWAFSDPGAAWRMGRKLTMQVMSGVRAGRSHALHRFEGMLTLQHMLESPNEFTTSLIISAMFGVQFMSREDQTLKHLVQVNDAFAQSVSNSGSIINVFPFLDAIPGRMPWRKRADEFRKNEEVVYGTLAKEAIDGKNSGLDNWAQYFAGKDNNNGDNRELINLLTLAAAHTTATTLQIFVLACMCHPEWIKTAQAHLDTVVGGNRLPNLSDREKIPYIEAVCREVLRWRPSARMAIPHKAMEDDIVEYNGQEYFIPKGSTVIGVPWIIEHDPSVYPDPDMFKPERWLDENGQLRQEGYTATTFGWGRRVCIGAPFAERSMWITVAMWLWTFNIRRSPGYQYTSDDSAFVPDFGTVPKPFPVIFEPRSSEHVDVANREWQEADKDLNILLPIVKRS